MYPNMKSSMLHVSTGSAQRWLLLPAFAAVLALFSVGCGHKNLLAPKESAASSAMVGQRLPAQMQALGEPVAALHTEGVSESGAIWAIDRPAHWNGDLVLYAHGYTNPSEPVALPNYFALRDSLLARGFGVATSSFSSNGYAAAEGVRETHELRGIFSEVAGRPQHTYVVGKSLGGLIAMILSQKYPKQYDGSLLVSGVVGGTTAEVQYMGDIRVLFDAVYGPVLGCDLYHPPVITDANAQVVGPVLQAITANPQGVGIIQMLARKPLPGNNTQEIVTSLITMLGFSMQGGGDLLERAHGHSYFGNANYTYTSSALPPALVADINTRVARYSRDPAAEQYLLHYGEADAPFRMPVITMHTSRDPVVPAFHETLLGQVAGGPNLRQYLTTRYGHAEFSNAEIMVRFNELVGWVASQQVALRGTVGRPELASVH